jgi:hypothetical protein
MANSQNQVRPAYGPGPKGKADIKLQGQTENRSNAWGADPLATGVVPDPTEYPPL